MSEVDSSCASCLLAYTGRDRVPKILSCYHTYCRTCVEQYMFQNGNITCLSCGKTTATASVESLPENPYIKPPEEDKRRRSGHSQGHGQEEFFYSDSEGEADGDEAHQAVENGIDGQRLKNIKDMVTNTQNGNLTKVRDLLEATIGKINSTKMVRKNKEHILREALIANDQFRKKLDEEFKNNENHNAQVCAAEAKLLNMKKQIEKIDPMDFQGLKSKYDEIIGIKKSLNTEADAARHDELQKSIRRSTIKINFDKCDEFLNNLKAENDTIFMKLSSSLETDPSMIFLTTFMLGNIFSEKISTHNPNFKDIVRASYLEDERDRPQPLDDVADLITYVNNTLKNLDVRSNHSQSPTAQASSPGSASGTASPADEKEWKVVSSKKDSKPKPLSFSDMAKKPGLPQPAKVRPFPDKTVAQTNRPHCYFKVQVDNDPPFRVVFELRPDMAPKMVDNFIRLCKGTADGKGYKGSRIFRAKADDHILGGDFENNDGTGGHSAYDERTFMAEQCPLKDHKGAIRMKGLERTGDGRCKIASQFMIWVGDLEYKEYRFTLVFGKVVEGFDQLQEVSRIKAVQKSTTSWILRQTVMVVDSGVL